MKSVSILGPTSRCRMNTNCCSTPRTNAVPQLLEHLAQAFPRHIQIHYRRYHRDELFEAARRSRACVYLADDDHGPLALQEILLAGLFDLGGTDRSLVDRGRRNWLVGGSSYVRARKTPRSRSFATGGFKWRGPDSNRRPRGYEPRELPGCSTPRH